MVRLTKAAAPEVNVTVEATMLPDVGIAAAGSQASSLKQQLEVHSARVRQLVNQIVRRSSLEDLNDPNLSTIKRLIRQEVNRLLRKSYVIEVVISDIRTMEQ